MNHNLMLFSNAAKAMVNLAETNYLLDEEEAALIESIHENPEFQEVGIVLSIGDGVAKALGLTNVKAGELVIFESGTNGIALNLEKDTVGIALFGSDNKVSEGDQVRRTDKIISIPTGPQMLGRVLDSLGNVIDGFEASENEEEDYGDGDIKARGRKAEARAQAASLTTNCVGFVCVGTTCMPLHKSSRPDCHSAAPAPLELENRPARWLKLICAAVGLVFVAFPLGGAQL